MAVGGGQKEKNWDMTDAATQEMVLCVQEKMNDPAYIVLLVEMCLCVHFYHPSVHFFHFHEMIIFLPCSGIRTNTNLSDGSDIITGHNFNLSNPLIFPA